MLEKGILNCEIFKGIKYFLQFIFEKIEKTNPNWTRTWNFDICFGVTFEC